MRTNAGVIFSVTLAAVCGIAGCRSTGTMARRSTDPAPVKKADPGNTQPRRLATPERKIEDVDGGWRWSKIGSKLLNPFSSPARRRPLPVSKALADNDEDATMPGFQ